MLVPKIRNFEASNPISPLKQQNQPNMIR